MRHFTSTILAIAALFFTMTAATPAVADTTSQSPDTVHFDLKLPDGDKTFSIDLPALPNEESYSLTPINNGTSYSVAIRGQSVQNNTDLAERSELRKRYGNGCNVCQS